MTSASHGGRAQRTHQLDQVIAAGQDARDRLRAAGDRCGRPAVLDEPGAWLRGRVDALRFSAALGLVRSCPHVSHSPEPVFMLAHLPLKVMCRRCMLVTLEASEGTEEDRTCDVCRRTGQPLRTSVAAVGPVLLVIGACQSCAPSIHPGAAK